MTTRPAQPLAPVGANPQELSKFEIDTHNIVVNQVIYPEPGPIQETIKKHGGLPALADMVKSEDAGSVRARPGRECVPSLGAAAACCGSCCGACRALGPPCLRSTMPVTARLLACSLAGWLAGWLAQHAAEVHDAAAWGIGLLHSRIQMQGKYLAQMCGTRPPALCMACMIYVWPDMGCLSSGCCCCCC
jgi:hypothetical protein